MGIYVCQVCIVCRPEVEVECFPQSPPYSLRQDLSLSSEFIDVARLASLLLAFQFPLPRHQIAGHLPDPPDILMDAGMCSSHFHDKHIAC